MAYLPKYNLESVMNKPFQLKVILLLGVSYSVMFSMTAMAQTFSPYTPAQIQEFNTQPIAPVETPAGPVYMDAPPVSQKPKASLDARYVKNPEGEEQAEAQSAESAAPFEPIPATFTF